MASGAVVLASVFARHLGRKGENCAPLDILFQIWGEYAEYLLLLVMPTS